MLLAYSHENLDDEKSNSTRRNKSKRKRDKKETYVFTKCIVVRVFDFMKVILIQLSNETSKIGMLEQSWQNRFGEIVHVLYEEQIGKKRYTIRRKKTHTFTTKQSPSGPQHTIF